MRFLSAILGRGQSSGGFARPMVRVVVAARTNRVSPTLPVIVSDDLNG